MLSSLLMALNCHILLIIHDICYWIELVISRFKKQTKNTFWYTFYCIWLYNPLKHEYCNIGFYLMVMFTFFFWRVQKIVLKLNLLRFQTSRNLCPTMLLIWIHIQAILSKWLLLMELEKDILPMIQLQPRKKVKLQFNDYNRWFMYMYQDLEVFCCQRHTCTTLLVMLIK